MLSHDKKSAKQKNAKAFAKRGKKLSSLCCEVLKISVFQDYFNTEIQRAKLSPEERFDYKESVKVYRDLINVVETAR